MKIIEKHLALRIIFALEKLGLGETQHFRNFVPVNGACANISKELGLNENLIYQVMKLSKSWEKYSGCEIYPVPAPIGDNVVVNVKNFTFMPRAKYYNPEKAAECYVQPEMLNYWEGEYGALRRELCLFLSDKLKKRIFWKWAFV